MWGLDQDHEAIAQAVRSFVEKEIMPNAGRWDREHRLPEDIFRRMGELGFLGICLPEEYGGGGSDLLSAALVCRELGRGWASLALSYGAHTVLCALNIARNASRSLCSKYLPGLIRGDLVGCMGLTEPGAGSDAVGITTRAKDAGDHFVLNGRKTFITNAPIADVALVYAKTDPSAGAKGITAFVVDRTMPGFSVSPPLEKMGHRASPTGDLVFEDCPVPKGNVVGKVNAGISVMMNGLDIERAFFAFGAVGLARRALELAISYSRERKQFGRPIGAFQLVQAKLADMYTRTEASELLALRACLDAQAMERGGKGTGIHRIAAAALLFAAEAAEATAYDALQIYGGYGYCEEYEVSRLYRDARLFTIGAGTSEIRRLVIGRELVGL